MNVGVIHDYIGTYSEKLDCLYPVYLVYQEIPHYNIVNDPAYFQPLIEKHFIPAADEPQEGDLLVFKLLNGYHFGIYVGDGRFAHCCKKYKLRISRLSMFEKYLKGVYRWFRQ